MRPEEALSAKLDAARVEHGEENRHLEKHRQASRHRTCSGFGIESHGFLLAYHGVLSAGILVVDRLYVRCEHTHLRLALVALVGEREKHKLDEDCEQKDDDPVIGDEFAEECEYRYDDAGVDPAEKAPAERNELLSS